MVGTCLEECNKVSAFTRIVKGLSAKIPVPCSEIIKDHNSAMGGVDLLGQKTPAYKLDSKSSGGRYCLRLFFDLMDISVVNFYAIYKVLYLKGMELIDFKIVLAKSLIGMYNSRSRNTPVSHVSRQEVLPAGVPLDLPVLQTKRGKCRYCYTGGTKHTFNVTYVELFCA